jgi:hypothetical protein
MSTQNEALCKLQDIQEDSVIAAARSKVHQETVRLHCLDHLEVTKTTVYPWVSGAAREKFRKDSAVPYQKSKELSEGNIRNRTSGGMLSILLFTRFRCLKRVILVLFIWFCRVLMPVRQGRCFSNPLHEEVLERRNYLASS